MLCVIARRQRRPHWPKQLRLDHEVAGLAIAPRARHAQLDADVVRLLANQAMRAITAGPRAQVRRAKGVLHQLRLVEGGGLITVLLQLRMGAGEGVEL